MRKQNLAASVASSVFIGLVALAAGPASAAVHCVNPGGTGGCFASIQAAVNAAAPGDTINVAAGGYAESVTIPAAKSALTINGAQAGNPVGARTFPSPAESTVTGRWTIHAPSTQLDGFSLTNPGQPEAVVVKTGGSGTVIRNNQVDTVAGVAFVGNVQAIYLELGPDDVQILDNEIFNVASQPNSAKAIFVGDSSSADPSLNILVEGNSIFNVTSGTRGAYGIQANNGASTAPTAIGFTTITIRGNVLDDMIGGGWAHAIGLEGPTPGVVVEGNAISDAVDLSPTPVDDAIAVFFEANPDFSTGLVNENTFDRVTWGIAVHPALSGAPVDGTCNWWSAANGPGPVGPGSGVMVSPNVTFTPWWIAPGGPCGGTLAGEADDCKDGGWQAAFRADGTGFRNQGDCMQYVNTGR